MTLSSLRAQANGLLIILALAAAAACSDDPDEPGADAGGADMTPAIADQTGGPDLLATSGGPLALKLEQVHITESGYQGTYTLLQITPGKQFVCTRSLYCKKDCIVSLSDTQYLGLLQTVQSSGFMTAAKKTQGCVDDMGYDRLSITLSGDGGVSKAVFEGQTLLCANVAEAVKTVYRALNELTLKVLPKAGCL